MKALRPFLLALACALPALAVAQWQWLDKDGRKVFSDRPPPADIAPDRVLKQPGGRVVVPAAAETDAASAAGATATRTAAAAPAASAPKLSGIDKELEARRKAQEAAEADKRKAEDAKVAQAKADNCNRARAAKANYESGVRVARTNAKGEREFLDDKQRAAELKRTEDIIARDCKQ